MIAVNNEFSTLRKVILGLGTPYQRDKSQVADEMNDFPFVPDTDKRDQVLSLKYPTEKQLVQEYIDYVSILERCGVEVVRADVNAAYSFDYTCPRDIGFVIGDMFFISSMAVPSRANEYKTILHHLNAVDPDKLIFAPSTVKLEGGDVIMLSQKIILLGINTRTDQNGLQFLDNTLRQYGYQIFPVYHQGLHLDCCLNPLGDGHLLIHPESLEGNPQPTWDLLKQYDWITVNTEEREYLATNILSINKNTIIARSHPVCSRVNNAMAKNGYHIEEIVFDGAPATGGSFRCASLPLLRQD